MKTNKFIAIMLLGVLATACSKDGNNRLTLLAEGFTNGNSKVLINDPNHPDSGATWIIGEKIKLNGNVYYIGQDDKNEYRLKNSLEDAEYVEPLNEQMTALYPGDGFGGNDVTVNSNEIVLNRLVVKMNSDGKQEMAFPMVAKADAGEDDLFFYHLSGGIQVKLHANTAVDIASLKIVAQNTEAVDNLDNLDTLGVTARWAVQGPSMPTGNIGDNGPEVNVKYISEMNFDLKSGNNNYASIAANGDLVFCVPITIASMKKLVFTGYDDHGAQLFHVAKDFDDEVTVDRNKMYTVPPINVN